jgi:hypothetical protein
MLRFLVLLLILANGAYFAWTQGYLASMGLAPSVQNEPQRLQNQIQPEAIRLLNPSEAKRVDILAAAPAPKPPECLQTTLLAQAQASALQTAAASLPAGAWKLEEATEPARWIVYMGKYPSAEALAKKKSELRELGISTEVLKNASLEPGLSLGAHASQADAAEAMSELAKRGVRTGKVVQEQPARTGQIFILPAVDDALRPQLEPVKTLLGASGLVSCKT